MKIDKRNFIDYTLLLLTIAVSGFPYFDSRLYMPLFIILFSVFLLRKKRLDWMFVLLLTLLLVITILQTYVFSFYSMETLVGLFLRIIVAYLIVKILGEKFIPYFINVLYGLAIVSLIIHLSALLVPEIGDVLFQLAPFFDILNFADKDRTIVIYNLNHLGSRNTGPFWEPGAFAGYLIIAFMFNFIAEKKKTDRKNIVLLIAIITTLSTTAFLAIFIFFSFIYYKHVNNIILRLGTIAIIILIGFYAYTTLDFLGEKIESQLQLAQKGIEKSDNSQRFLSLLRDIKDLQGHELIGRGGSNFTRFDLRPGNKFIIPTVGLTDILVRVGIPFFLYMFYLLYASICAYLEKLYKRNYVYCTGIFITFLVILLSETYFNYPLFWSFLFLQLIYKKDNTKNVMQSTAKYVISSKTRGNFDYKS